MSKATIIFAIVCLCVAVQAQTTVRPRDREICQTENAKCLRNERRLGRESDISNIFNNHCRGADRSWRNITRCELSLATCRLTLENCSLINCQNVKRTLGGGGVTGRPPTSPRTTTRRTPTPRTPSPAPRTPSPRTTTTRRSGTRTPSPRSTTTRRTPGPRTPSPRTTTTRRSGPRTPSPRRTTTRRPLED
ncbi:salivary glue protein Sgs-3 [Drosophila elegans]|uniref:salivary glue protein Sgs-3 n=1 Tax=Drosophila elegans TaxID=30023 RepID=UPI001BC83DA8|nr:salivary glue protein Sgs-3 [Drosophila elegans]